MKVVSITGSEKSETRALVARLVDRLSERGDVATVLHPSRTSLANESEPRGSRQQVGSSTTYGLTDQGWFVTGKQRSLDTVLEHLSPEHDFAVIEGFDETGFPDVVIGNGDIADNTLVAAKSASAVDVQNVVNALANSEGFETLHSLVDRVKASSEAEKAGAIATFTGRVRAKEHEDDAFTEQLEFERYDAIATDRMATIREELEERDGVYEVLMHHRTGTVEYGEDIVFVVVLAGHRTEAFRTVEDAIDRLKEEVPLFKKEVTVEDEYWAHR